MWPGKKYIDNGYWCNIDAPYAKQQKGNSTVSATYYVST